MALQTGEPHHWPKIWDDHIVVSGGAVRPTDLHRSASVHEVASPQAFDGACAWPGARCGVATPRHRGSQRATVDIDQPIADPVSRTQVETLRRNCAEFESGCIQ